MEVFRTYVFILPMWIMLLLCIFSVFLLSLGLLQNSLLWEYIWKDKQKLDPDSSFHLQTTLKISHFRPASLGNKTCMILQFFHSLPLKVLEPLIRFYQKDVEKNKELVIWMGILERIEKYLCSSLFQQCRHLVQTWQNLGDKHSPRQQPAELSSHRNSVSCSVGRWERGRSWSQGAIFRGGRRKIPKGAGVISSTAHRKSYFYSRPTQLAQA